MHICTMTNKDLNLKYLKTLKSYYTLARRIVEIAFESKVKSAETTRRVESLTADLSTITKALGH